MTTQNAQPLFDPAKYKITEGTHDKKKILWVHFPKDEILIAALRNATKAKWSHSQKCWYLTDNAHNRTLFGLPVAPTGKDLFLRIHDVNRPAFQRLQEQLILKGYSPTTQKTYLVEFAALLAALKTHLVDDLTPERLRSYFLYCHKELGLSENHLHSRINAVKFYFEQVLYREKFFFDIPRPKKPLQLPKALSTTEIKKLFAATENLKHELILRLGYGMGLRVSEIVCLRIADIDSSSMRVLVACGKGKKDRYVNLPATVLEKLREYYKAYRPKEFLFEGQEGGAYSARSAQAVFKTAMNRAGIRKTVGIHSLRHSYATHLLELGTDITFIQKLLGHNDLKTTPAYTHVADRSLAAVGSPLDRL